MSEWLQFNKYDYKKVKDFALIKELPLRKQKHLRYYIRYIWAENSDNLLNKDYALYAEISNDEMYYELNIKEMDKLAKEFKKWLKEK